MEYEKIEEKQATIKIFSSRSLNDEFIPWGKGERGQQSYIRLERDKEVAYLYAGAGSIMQAEVQKTLMILVNDGWKVTGDLNISFDGAPDIASDRLLCRHEITVEIGPALLPLVDPFQGAPLFEKLNLIREDLAYRLGFLLPGINVKDNMALPQNSYVIKLRESPKGRGEIYIDRLLAIGSTEALSKVQGWSIIEPTYRMNAKWIEPKDREAAEEAGCMVQGALNVILTHIANTISNNAAGVLGLQEVYNLLSDMLPTHPVLVEEFLNNIKELRRVKKILCELLNENVPLRDLLTIMEVIGENIDDISNTEFMVNQIRQALASQICWELTEADGCMRILTINEALEKQIKSLLTEGLGGAFLSMTEEEEDLLLKKFKDVLSGNELPPVLVTDPQIRIHMFKFLSANSINMAVLGCNEIPHDIKVIATDQLKGSIITEKKGAKKKGDPAFWMKQLAKGSKK